MKSHLQIEVEGRTLGLKFNMNTLRFIEELTGKDPFEFKTESQDYKDVVPYAKIIFHAGLLSNCASLKMQPDFTQENVDTWFGELHISELTLIVNAFNSPVKYPASANGEIGKDTQQAVNVD